MKEHKKKGSEKESETEESCKVLEIETEKQDRVI